MSNNTLTKKKNVIANPLIINVSSYMNIDSIFEYNFGCVSYILLFIETRVNNYIKNKFNVTNNFVFNLRKKYSGILSVNFIAFVSILP